MPPFESDHITPSAAIMNRKSIDQTTSELQLHRVLYVIKLLRAMVLHVTLTAFAALPYFFVGISVYPVGTLSFKQSGRYQSSIDLE